MREVVAHDGLDFSNEDYESMILAKTASLIAGACELGALAGGANWRGPLHRFGISLGVAFQIADDLLDYTATEQVAGKPVGQDLREHKVTLPLIVAVPRMSADERLLVEALMANPSPGDSEIAVVIQIVEQRGGIIAARERAFEMVQWAEAELEEVPSGIAKDALSASITYCVERSR
jgi:octaprenyl-diphosphate synthase